MRWRNTAVYLIILLLVGGYFYYFEVVRKEEKQAAEKESKRVFSFNPEAVTAIEVAVGRGQPVRVEKKDGWRIVKPVGSEVDRSSFDSFFGALRGLDTVRKLGPAPEKLEAFGLADPPLKIRFEAGGEWFELAVGGLNPAGDARYARKAGGADIFLIDQLAFQSLDVGLKELRKKELFAWRTDQVLAMDVEWRSGEKVRFERREGEKEWTAAGRPELKIKGAKLDSLIDQVRWLRAVDFLDESAKPDPPAVKVLLHLKGGGNSEIALGDPDPAAKQVVASTSAFNVPVKIASHFLLELPKSAEAFLDRSILTHNAAEVREVRWKRAGAEGSAVRTGESKWEIGGKPLEGPALVPTLLDEAARTEYLDKAESGPDLSGADANYLEFMGADRKLASLAWPALPEEDTGTLTARLELDGKTSDVRLQLQALRPLDEAVDELALAAGAKRPQ
ncbi:MAG: DUF4340 domain-containing protein [Syntrophobacteraceae bacterium]